MKTMLLLQRIVIALVIVACSAGLALALTTNGSSKQFDFAITSGKNNNLSSSNYQNYVVIGDITGSTTSANFNNDVGFLITNPFINGEACKINAECKSNVCCDNVCASSCDSGSSGSSGGSSGGSGGGSSGGTTGTGGSAPTNVSRDVHNHFFSSIEAGQQYSSNVKGDELAVVNVTFTTKENLSDVDISIALVKNPEASIENPYQYFRITAQKLNTNNIEEMNIVFRVPIEAGYDVNKVTLQRFDGSLWKSLPTKRMGSDSTYYYFESQTDDVGLFVIDYGLKPKEKPPFEETTGQVVKEPEDEKPDIPQILPPEAPIKKKVILGFMRSLLGILILIVVVLGILYYRMAEQAQERRTTYHEFKEIMKYIYKHLEDGNIRTAVALYKKLMPDYIYLMKSDKITIQAKAQIKNDFELVYKVLDKRVKDARYNIPGSYWRK